MFEGASVFRVQASKEQQPDTYFGGLDIEDLKSGIIRHNTKGSLVECEFGFIDEIFDANDFTLRALLSLLNERRLLRGVQNVPAAIHTVIASTNYMRVTEVTEALLDRFMFKALILPDKEPYNQFKIAQKYLQHGGRTATPPAKIPFSELRSMHDIISGNNDHFRISIRPEDLYFMNLVVRHYEFLKNRSLRESHKGQASAHYNDFYISPRTQAKSIDLLRALALLRALYKKAFSAVQNSLLSAHGFEQISTLLAFETLLMHIRDDHELINLSLGELTQTPSRRSFFDWFKDTFGGLDKTVAQNQRSLEKFLAEFSPSCDEVRELKSGVEQLMTKVFQEIEREQSRKHERANAQT